MKKIIAAFITGIALIFIALAIYYKPLVPINYPMPDPIICGDHPDLTGSGTLNEDVLFNINFGNEEFQPLHINLCPNYAFGLTAKFKGNLVSFDKWNFHKLTLKLYDATDNERLSIVKVYEPKRSSNGVLSIVVIIDDSTTPPIKRKAVKLKKPLKIDLNQCQWIDVEVYNINGIEVGCDKKFSFSRLSDTDQKSFGGHICKARAYYFE